MTISVGQDCVILEGDVVIEEADTLHAALAAQLRPVELGSCRSIHTAVLGILLAARPPIGAMPALPLLASLLAGLPRADGTGPAVVEPDIAPLTEGSSGKPLS